MVSYFFLRFGVSDFSFLNAEISTSQNDVRGDLLKVDNNSRSHVSCFTFTTQKSLSDTDINKSSNVSWLQQCILHLVGQQNALNSR